MFKQPHYHYQSENVSSVYLFVEVEESFGAVNVVERGEGLDGTIDGHGVKPHRSPRGDQHPVRRRTTDEHLCQKGKMWKVTEVSQYVTGKPELSNDWISGVES